MGTRSTSCCGLKKAAITAFRCDIGWVATRDDTAVDRFQSLVAIGARVERRKARATWGSAFTAESKQYPETVSDLIRASEFLIAGFSRRPQKPPPPPTWRHRLRGVRGVFDKLATGKDLGRHRFLTVAPGSSTINAVFRVRISSVSVVRFPSHGPIRPIGVAGWEDPD